MQVLGALQLMGEWAYVGMISTAGAGREHFRDGRCRALVGQFLGAEEPAKRVAIPSRAADVTLVPEASVGVEWRASGSLASRP
jgi:hypothetical protein